MAGTAIPKIAGTGNVNMTDIANSVTKGNSSFKKVMTGAMYSNIGNSVSKQQSTSGTGNLKDAIKTYTDKNDIKNTSTKTDVNNYKKNNTSSKSVNYSDKKNNLSSKDMSKVSDSVENIKNVIKEELGISDEELENVMSVLGLTIADLFNQQNITDVFMMLTGTNDTMDILMDAQLTQSFQNIQSALESAVNSISDATGLDTQQILDIIRNNISDVVQDDKNIDMHQEESVIASDNSDMSDENVSENEKITSSNEKTMNNISQSVEQKIKIQTDNKSSDTMNGQKDSATTQNTKTTVSDITANLVQNIQNSFEQAMEVSSTQSVNAADIVKQIINSVKVGGNNLIQSMEIQLNPEHLGKVTLTVTSKSGVITAELVAQNEQVKKALETQINTLKENLQNQGIKIEAVEVVVQSHSFESGQNLKGNNSEQGKNSKGTRRHISLEEFEEMSDDSEQLIDNLVKNENSSVEYTA